MNFGSNLVGSQKNGNIAIKCNYCDGGKDANHIGFSGVCSDRIIKYNIDVEHRVWCSNDRCPCFQYYNRRITRNRLNEIMSTPSDFVCYESTMLSDWMTQAGLTEEGQTKRFGSTLHAGAACVFTTRLPDMDECDRFIFGIFIIDELFYGDNNRAGYVKCNTDYHIELTPDESKRLKFWNYYRNKNTPEKEQWGTGLYRFISNNSIIAMLTDLLNIRDDSGKEEVIRFLNRFCSINHLKMPDEFEGFEHSIKHEELNRESFIEKLKLPKGFEAKRFEGMNRIHFKYLGIGYFIVDLKNSNYNLASREEYLNAIGVKDYSISKNLGPNRAIIKDIPYNNTEVLYKLLSYISNESVNADFETKQLKLEEENLEKNIAENNLIGTDKIAVVKARVNQGVFRDRLIRKYGKCCLCGADEEGMLVASHIKPWVDSTPEERVDDNNGLLLCPNHDKLFDRGYITFADDGLIMITETLSDNNRMFLNIYPELRIELEPETARFMKYHREKIFMDRECEPVVQENETKASEDKPVDSMPVKTSYQTVDLGPLPNGLLNYSVEDNKYGDGKIIHVDSKTFELEVEFDDDERKTFVFPSCFLSGRLSMKDEDIQKSLEAHLKNYH